MAVIVPRSNPFNHKFRGCSSIADYEVLGKLGEGTFGEVHKARSKGSGMVVALKKILMHNEKDGFPVTAIREIKLLKMLSHTNVLRLEEMAIERAPVKERKKAIMYMVTPYMEHDLSGLLTNPDVHFTEPQIKCYMLQLLEGLRYLHASNILHRDMKAANLLISNKGVLQIADFGLARHYDEIPPSAAGQGYNDAKRDYTALVVTRWYRPPELFLGLRRYTPAIDMWGVGCVFGEMFKRVPILQGGSDIAQIQMIFDLVGSPTEDTMPGWTALPGCEGLRDFELSQSKVNQKFRELNASACSLLNDLLKLNWRKRITALSALQHPYFRAQPAPAKPHELPTFDDSHELDHRKSRGQKGPPPAPAGGTVGMGAQGPGEWAGPAGGAHTNGSAPQYESRPGSRDIRGGPSAAQDRGYDSRRPGGPTSAARRPGWVSGGADQNDSRLPGPPPRGEADAYRPLGSSQDDRDRNLDRDNRDRGLRDRDNRDRDNRDRERNGDRERDQGRSYDWDRDRNDGRHDYRGRYDYDREYDRHDRDRRDYTHRERGGDRDRWHRSDRLDRPYDDRSRRNSRSRSPDRTRERPRESSDPYARR